MNPRFAASMSMAAVMTVLAAVPIAAQAPAAIAKRRAAAAPWTPPKTPWGEPDLQGSWPTASLVGTPFERPAQFGERRLLTNEEIAAREKQYADDAERVAKSTEAGADVDDWTGPPAHWNTLVVETTNFNGRMSTDIVGYGSPDRGASPQLRITSVVVGLEDVSTYPALLAELIRRGYTDEDIKKIAARNILRVMRGAEAAALKLRTPAAK